MNDELSHELLHFIDRIDWRSLIKSKQWLSGRHSSFRRGSSPEFKEFREHRSGEDVHLIDWKASARAKFPLVREKEHQGVLKQWIWIDNSASMNFPATEFNKFRRLKMLGGALLYLFQAIGDRFSVTFDSERGPCLSPPTRGQQALQQHIARLTHCEILDKPFSGDLLHELKEHLHQPSALWLLTDFDSDPTPLLAQLVQLKKFGHEIRVLHLYHPDEAEFPWRGPHVFVDAEGVFGDVALQPELLRSAYIEQYQRHCQTLRSTCENGQLTYLAINVCDSPETWIANLLATLPA